MSKKLIFLFLFLNSLIAEDCDYNATATADNLNLAYQDYNFLMGLSGLFAGVVFYFIVADIVKRI